MTSRFLLRLTGDNACLGELYACDLARLLDGVERAIGRAAAQLAGRAPGAAGRLPKAVAEASRLRLTGIRQGSLVLELAPPNALGEQEAVEQEALELNDSQLAESAFNTVMDVISGSETGFPETAADLKTLAEELDIGERYDALAFAKSGDVTVGAVLDRSARERLSAAVPKPTRSDDDETLAGTLYEADFEKNTARLRTCHGPSVSIRFDEDHAQDIKQALRENSQLQGRVTRNDATSAIVAVHLTGIASAEQLTLMPRVEEFWSRRSLDELAQAQGVGIVESIEMLQDDTISDEEAEAFIAALEL